MALALWDMSRPSLGVDGELMGPDGTAAWTFTCSELGCVTVEGEQQLVQYLWRLKDMGQKKPP